MKPSNWNKLSKKRKKAIAVELLNSMRGAFIISQALTKGIEVMKKAPENKKERSNIEDMEILRDELFPIFYIAEKMEKKLMKKIKSK